MGFSALFIKRPIGTMLLALGLLLAGLVAYRALPVASLPNIEFPTIVVSASRPGADPITMATTIAAPLERRLGAIAGVTEISSTSSLGTTRIIVQFDLARKIESAARDVQAALNAAAADLPSDLPTLPSFRKANPNAQPILILALTSDTIAPSAMYDIADSVIAQRISQVSGVGEVSVSGAEQPAIRVAANPAALGAIGMGIDTLRSAIASANALSPVGQIDGTEQAVSLAVNSQLRTPDDYGALILRSTDGKVTRLSSVADVTQGVRNTRSAAWYNGKPAVLINVTKQADANVIATVEQIRNLLPELKRWIPAGIETHVLVDRTGTIRASVDDMQWTLAGSIALVMMVVALFLRRAVPVLAAGVTVPLSLAGAFVSMWAIGYSLDNLSLMALAIAVGFVVDDAIVMIENIDRSRAQGLSPLAAALAGARQISFTLIAISISLVAAFIPLLLMGGVQGRFFREFGMVLTAAIAVSTIVSLTLTPALCAMAPAHERKPGRIGRWIETGLARTLSFYEITLRFALREKLATMIVFIATIIATVQLYIITPKGFFPQDDTGLLFAFVETSTDVSFPVMADLQRKVEEVIAADPAVSAVGSTIGGSVWSGAINNGRLWIALKPFAERKLTSEQVVARLRQSVKIVPGASVWLSAVQDLRMGGRSSRSPFQFTLWGPDTEALDRYAPLVEAKLKAIPGLVDVNSDREPSGLQANVTVDRAAAARLGVSIQDVSAVLNNAFAQRQISTVYTQRNQYRVVLEVGPNFRRDPSDLDALFVPAKSGTQVPLSAVARVERALAPVAVRHQGPFPAITISYALRSGTSMDQASDLVRKAVQSMHLPESIRTDFAGDAKAFRQNTGGQPLLILAAIIAVYLVLGILYESLIHPLTIISTLPAAGLGALLALNAVGSELTIIAFIGIIMLIGIVKKNGIILVDFALEAQRHGQRDAESAIIAACLERFRPILMTTLAAMLGALPLVLATGAGSELRRPLGITIVGGLLVSQILTLYTTPVIFILFDRLQQWLSRRRSATRVLENQGTR
jgi:multidrug efflux pump